MMRAIARETNLRALTSVAPSSAPISAPERPTSRDSKKARSSPEDAEATRSPIFCRFPVTAEQTRHQVVGGRLSYRLPVDPIMIMSDARDQRIETLLAECQLIRPEHVFFPRARDRFRREATAAAERVRALKLGEDGRT